MSKYPEKRDEEISVLKKDLVNLKNKAIDEEFEQMVRQIHAERESMTSFTKLIKAFTVENRLSTSWDKFPVDYTHI